MPRTIFIMQNILSNEIQQQQQRKSARSLSLVLSVAIVCVCVGWFSLSNAQDSVSFGLFFAFVSEIWHLIAVVRAHHEYESTDIHIYRMFIYIYQLKESIRIYIYIFCVLLACFPTLGHGIYFHWLVISVILAMHNCWFIRLQILKFNIWLEAPTENSIPIRLSLELNFCARWYFVNEIFCSSWRKFGHHTDLHKRLSTFLFVFHVLNDSHWNGSHKFQEIYCNFLCMLYYSFFCSLSSVMLCRYLSLLPMRSRLDVFCFSLFVVQSCVILTLY